MDTSAGVLVNQEYVASYLFDQKNVRDKRGKVRDFKAKVFKSGRSKIAF